MLTLSMHGPFNDLQEYMHECMQMDQSLSRYINSLKERGLYDNSIIFLASDHGRDGDNALGLDRQDLTQISFFAINAPRCESYRKSPCNQLDIFTSITDILGIHEIDGYQWDGLGCSIFHPDRYQNSISDTTWGISSLILSGDYFRLRNYCGRGSRAFGEK